MKLLVAALEKRKFAVNECAHPHSETSGDGEPLTEPPRQRGGMGEGGEPSTQPPRQYGEASEGGERPRAAPLPRGEATDGERSTERPPKRDEAAENCGPSTQPQSQHGRYIPAAVRSEVYQRDGARCTYVDARGLRCAETRYLELHHLQPFAKNGAHVTSNLTLRCSAHNALAAERDFGRTFVAERRCSSRHQALAQHQTSRS